MLNSGTYIFFLIHLKAMVLHLVLFVMNVTLTLILKAIYFYSLNTLRRRYEQSLFRYASLSFVIRVYQATRSWL